MVNFDFLISSNNGEVVAPGPNGVYRQVCLIGTRPWCVNLPNLVTYFSVCLSSYLTGYVYLRAEVSIKCIKLTRL